MIELSHDIQGKKSLVSASMKVNKEGSRQHDSIALDAMGRHFRSESVLKQAAHNNVKQLLVATNAALEKLETIEDIRSGMHENVIALQSSLVEGSQSAEDIKSNILNSRNMIESSVKAFKFLDNSILQGVKDGTTGSFGVKHTSAIVAEDASGDEIKVRTIDVGTAFSASGAITDVTFTNAAENTIDMSLKVGGTTYTHAAAAVVVTDKDFDGTKDTITQLTLKNGNDANDSITLNLAGQFSGGVTEATSHAPTMDFYKTVLTALGLKSQDLSQVVRPASGATFETNNPDLKLSEVIVQGEYSAFAGKVRYDTGEEDILTINFDNLEMDVLGLENLVLESSDEITDAEQNIKEAGAILGEVISNYKKHQLHLVSVSDALGSDLSTLKKADEDTGAVSEEEVSTDLYITQKDLKSVTNNFMMTMNMDLASSQRLEQIKQQIAAA